MRPNVASPIFRRRSRQVKPAQTRRLNGLAIQLCGLFWLFGCATVAQNATPGWVSDSGISSRYPRESHVVGYQWSSGDGALERAKQGAVADLGRQISVRIQSELTDQSEEIDGKYGYKLDAVTRSTSDVKLTDVRYELYRKRGTIHALAVVHRATAARTRRLERDKAVSDLTMCMDAAGLEKASQRRARALRIYESCRRSLAEALQHESVAIALTGNLRSGEIMQQLMAQSRTIDHEIDLLASGPASSIEDAADALVLQLTRQGVTTADRLIVSPFSYGSTNFSSSLGKQLAIELEESFARSNRNAEQKAHPRELYARGVYYEFEGNVRVSVTTIEAQSGLLTAGAEVRFPISSIPPHLELRAINFEAALEKERVLSRGESISGDLKIKVWTDRGYRSVVYSENEELRLYLRVNRPAWVRLLYTLANGEVILLEDDYFLDSPNVNVDFEYPTRFEIAPPFGIETIHAMAFTKEPPALPTATRKVDGVTYKAVPDGVTSVIKARGLVKRKRGQTVAEDFVTITTTR